MAGCTLLIQQGEPAFYYAPAPFVQACAAFMGWLGSPAGSRPPADGRLHSPGEMAARSGALAPGNALAALQRCGVRRISELGRL